MAQWWVIALILLGGALRLHDLGAKSLWVDEAKAVQISRELEDILPYARSGNTPPLRYYAMHYLQQGTRPEFMIRLPSAIASILCIPLMFAIGARLFNPAAGVVAAALFAFSPWQIDHAQDGRMYSVFLLFTLLSLYALFRAQEEHRWRWYVLLGAMYALAAHLTYFGLWASFIITVYIIACRAICLASRRGAFRFDNALRFKGLAVALVVAGIVYMPWLVNLAPLLAKYDIPGVGALMASPPAPPSPPGLHPMGTVYGMGYFEDFFAKMGATSPVAAYGLLALAVGGLAWCWFRRRDFFLFSVLWFSIPVAILLLTHVSWFFPPRYLIYYHLVYLWLAGAGLVALGRGVAHAIPRHHFAAYYAVILVPLLIFGVFFMRNTIANYHDPNQNWRAAAFYLKQVMQPGDTLITGQLWTEQALLYYYDYENEPVTTIFGLFDMGRFEAKLASTRRLWYVNWGPLPPQVQVIVDRHLEPVRAIGDILIFRRRD